MASGGYVAGLEARARDVLPEPVFRYFSQGSRESVSAGEAASAWDRFRFLPHVLRDVTQVDLATDFLGSAMPGPVGIAPLTMQRAADPGGEVEMARGAAEAGAVMVLSSNAGSTFEDVAGTGVVWWLQVYLTADRPACLPLLRRAVAAGASAVVLTADTPVVGTKYDVGETVWDRADPSWLKVNFPAGHGSRPDHEKAADLGAHDIDWLRTTTGLPVVVKGVLRAGDARRCIEAGASAVWVSNHGGRQLDHVAATADCLEAVVEEVGNDAQVYVDGGIRSGRHALTALALGADAVFLGRLALYALAADGRTGVGRLLEDVSEELAEGLRLGGCASVAAARRGLLAPPRNRP